MALWQTDVIALLSGNPGSMRTHCKFFVASAVLVLLSTGLYLVLVSPHAQLLKRPAVVAARAAVVVGSLAALGACFGGIVAPPDNDGETGENTPLLNEACVVAAAAGHNSLPYLAVTINAD